MSEEQRPSVPEKTIPESGIQLSGDGCIREYIYVAIGAVAALLMGHAGAIGLYIGAAAFLGLIVYGLSRPSSLWVAAVMTLYPLDSVPSELGLREGIFVCAMSGFFLQTFWSCRKYIKLVVPRSLILFSAVCLAFLSLNLWVAQTNDVSILEWLRGLVPFLFVTVSFPVAIALLANPGFLRPMVLSLLLLSSLFALRIIIVYLDEELWEPIRWVFQESTETWIKVEEGSGDLAPGAEVRKFLIRVTHVLPQSTSILVLLSVVWGSVAFSITNRKAGVLGIMIACVGISGVALTYTRSMVIAIAAVLFCVGAFLALYRREKLSRFFVCLAILTGVFCLTLTAFDLAGIFSDRFGMLVSDGMDVNVTARLEEYKIAWDMFLESPLTGKGLGAKHTMLFSVGFGEVLEQEVSYVHNWVLYFLSLGGVFGFLIYVWIVVTPLYLVSKNHFFRTNLGLTVYATLGCLICFALFFAVFRLIPFNIVLGCLAGVGMAIRSGEGRLALCAES